MQGAAYTVGLSIAVVPEETGMELSMFVLFLLRKLQATEGGETRRLGCKIHHCLCPNCQSPNASTTILPTNTFHESVIMSLTCPDGNFHDSQINIGGTIQPRGQRTVLTVSSRRDLDRQIVKSDSATVFLPSVDDFEIPQHTQVGVCTIEGLLRQAACNLEKWQAERLRLGDVDNFHRCRCVVSKLKRIVDGCIDGDDEEEDDEVNLHNNYMPFNLILDDAAGNSFIENPYAPSSDPNTTTEEYIRTPAQDIELGLQASTEDEHVGELRGQHSVDIDECILSSLSIQSKSNHSQQSSTTEIGRDEVMKFPTNCPSCNASSETDICVIVIPHFKEVIIMFLFCEQCGYRSSEIKGGGAIPSVGTRTTLQVDSADDLAREVLKSDTAGISIPELDLELNEGGLDGVYTTVEGLLMKMHDRLKEVNPFGVGDTSVKHHANNDDREFSDPLPRHARFVQFLSRLKAMAEGRVLPFVLVISDPLSNSFIGPIPEVATRLALQAEKEGSLTCYETFVDEGLSAEEYERTNEQNVNLGLSDMITEHYQTTTGADEAEHSAEYYGTDQMSRGSDRLRFVERYGPDHPS